jgi:DNA-binding protein YbaB
MSLLGQMKDMYKLQKQAKKIKKELAKIHVFAESNGIKVTVSAEMEVMNVEILDEEILKNAPKLAKAMLEATNRAIKKAQQISAERMKDMMGGMPGMPGM